MGTEFCNVGLSLNFGSVASRSLKASAFYHPDLSSVSLGSLPDILNLFYMGGLSGNNPVNLWGFHGN